MHTAPERGMIGLRNENRITAASFRREFTQVGETGKRAGAMFAQAGLDVGMQLSPLGMVATLIGGAMEGLAPLMDALQEPLRMVGEILGKALAPILKALFPVFKLVAIAATYIGEVFFKVAGWINTGIGKLLEGIGKLLNKLPGSIGNPLIKAGEAMQAMGQGFDDGARALREGREQLKDLDWDDALAKVGDTANKVSEELTNMPQGFKIAAHRFNATLLQAATPTARSAAMPAGIAPAASAAPISIEVNVTEAESASETGREVIRQLRDRLRNVLGDDARSLDAALAAIAY